jgi:hypothetical protein
LQHKEGLEVKTVAVGAKAEVRDQVMMGMMAVMTHTVGVLLIPLPLASVYLTAQKTRFDFPVRGLAHFVHNPEERGEQ